jgi:hypothetical protein
MVEGSSKYTMNYPPSSLFGGGGGNGGGSGNGWNKRTNNVVSSSRDKEDRTDDGSNSTGDNSPPPSQWNNNNKPKYRGDGDGEEGDDSTTQGGEGANQEELEEDTEGFLYPAPKRRGPLKKRNPDDEDDEKPPPKKRERKAPPPPAAPRQPPPPKPQPKSVQFSDLIKLADGSVHYSNNNDPPIDDNNNNNNPNDEGGAHGGGTGGGGGECRACRLGYFVEQTRLTAAISEFVKKFSHNISVQSLINEVYALGQHERMIVIEESGGVDPGEWSREDVEHHLFYCMSDMSLCFLKEVHDLKLLLKTIKDHVITRNDESNSLQLNEKNLRLMMQIQTQIKVLLTTAPEKSVSFNPQLAVHSSKRKSQGKE